MTYNPQYPSSEDLKARTEKRIPKFLYEYLEGGCFDNNAVDRSTHDMRRVLLKQNFVRPIIKNPDLKASLCGIEYDLPIGVAPVGIQGFIWPNAPIILSKMARDYNIPYVLSTMSTNSIEEVARASDNQALFQLYNPEDEDIRKDLIRRLKDAGYRALIVTADIASFGYRPCDIKNGLSLPPNATFKNFWQAAIRPEWAIRTLCNGFMPQLKTLTPYMQNVKAGELSLFMSNKMLGGVSPEHLKMLRDMWDGPLIIKGILSEPDMELCIQYGIDGVVVSDHGARQFNAGQTPISVLPSLAKKYGKKIHMSFDGSISSGSDIACALASGAQMTFSGRTFTYGVAALGNAGGTHTIEMLQKQLIQVLCQMGCDSIADLPKFLVNDQK